MFLLSEEKNFLEIYKISENMHFWLFSRNKTAVKACDYEMKF